jgi:hypothetical protein
MYKPMCAATIMTTVLRAESLAAYVWHMNLTLVNAAFCRISSFAGPVRRLSFHFLDAMYIPASRAKHLKLLSLTLLYSLTDYPVTL